MLTLQNTEAIRRIEEAIGYTFNDKRLLVQVLTRKTYLKIDPEAPDNEVLEFYGDTLMNYHVTNYFMSKYAHMLDDGLFFMRTVEQFTDMRSHYVCNRYLTDRIKAMGLARYLRAQNRDSELRRDGEKAYADIFESLVGAIYLDSYQNDALIRAFILRQLGIEPKRLPADIEAFDYDSLTVPASVPTEEEPVALEEPETIADLPADEIADAEEIPAQAEPAAVAEVAPAEADHVEEPAVVEEAPAKEAPAEEVPAVEAPASLPIPVPEKPVTAVAVLHAKQEALAAFCRQWGFEQPTYGETPPNAPNARPVAACTMKYKDSKGKLVKISLNDSGRTLAEATEKAAAKMLKKLEKQTADAIAKEKKAADKPVETAAETAAETVADTAEQPAPEAREPARTAPVEAVTEAVAEMAVEAVTDTVTEAVTEEKATEAEAVEPAETLEAVETAPTEAEPAAEVAPVEEQSAVNESPDQSVEAASTEQGGSVPRPETVQTVAADEAPVAEVAPEMRKVPVPEPAPVEEFIQQTMILNMEEPMPAEEIRTAKNSRKKKPESTDGEVGEPKPAKSKRSPAKKKAPPAEDKPAEEVAVTEGSAETPEKTAKPRTRKPRAKKMTESEAAVNEGETSETSEASETA